MTRQLALAEFGEDVSLLATENGAMGRWVAVTPLAMDALESAGHPYGIETDYCTPGELDRIGLENFDRAERLCEVHDSFLRERCPVLAAWGLHPLRDHFTRVKFLLDAVTTRLHIMTKILDQEQPDAVMKVRAPGRTAPLHLEFFYTYTASESLYGDVLAIVAGQRDVPVRWVGPPRSRRGDRVKGLWRLNSRLRTAVRLGLGLRLSRAWRRPHGPQVLLLGVGYDIDPLIQAPGCRSFQFLHLHVPRLRLRPYPGGLPLRLQVANDARLQFKREFAGVRAELEALRLGESVCQVRGCDLFPLVQPRLLHYLDSVFPRVALIRDYLEALTARYSIDAVVSPWAPPVFDLKAVFAFFAQASVPTLVVQHGGYGHIDNPVTNYSEFNFSGRFLAWGPGVFRHYGPTKKGPVNFVPTGSVLLDQIVAWRQSRRPDPTKVMYVITEFRGYSAYFPGGQVDLDTAYYRLQQDVIRLLGQFGHRYSVVLKIPPGFNGTDLYRSPLLRWVERGRYRLTLNTRPLGEGLHDVGLFIIDCPSTTLIQCAATRASLIVYSGAPHHSVVPAAEDLLAKRAICCRTREAFLHAIERTLVEGVRPSPLEVNDEFLAEYGTYLKDGKSAERMAEQLSGVYGYA
jgi:hypothetical protein